MFGSRSGRFRPAILIAAGVMAVVGGSASAAAPTHPRVTRVASTVPANGDLNPYGLAVVPTSVGRLHAGSLLVDNFNAASNLQGTGTTLVQIAPDGHGSLFATVPRAGLPPSCSAVGLDTALGVLRSGWVIVGSLGTTDGTAATAQAGCILILDSGGVVRTVLSGDDIAGPWDMTLVDGGSWATLFVSNVLVGNVIGAGGAVVNQGSVLRLQLAIPAHGVPQVTARQIIASGFGERTDPAALVVGPTGLALGPDGTLYVADTVDNRIAAIPNALTRRGSALTGRDVTAGGALNAPLGLALDRRGNLVSVNGGDGNAVETTPSGQQVGTAEIDRSGVTGGAGTLFGIARLPASDRLYFVDDGDNTLDLVNL